MTDEKKRNNAHTDSIRDSLVNAYNGIFEDDCEDFYEYVLDMLEGCYSIEYRIDSDKTTVLSAEIMVACGGPNIYIDTKEQEVQLYWWGSSAKSDIPKEVCDAINDILQDVWSC